MEKKKRGRPKGSTTKNKNNDLKNDLRNKMFGNNNKTVSEQKAIESPSPVKSIHTTAVKEIRPEKRKYTKRKDRELDKLSSKELEDLTPREIQALREKSLYKYVDDGSNRMARITTHLKPGDIVYSTSYKNISYGVVSIQRDGDPMTYVSWDDGSKQWHAHDCLQKVDKKVRAKRGRRTQMEILEEAVEEREERNEYSEAIGFFNQSEI